MKKIKYYFNKIFYRTDFIGLSVFGRGQSFDWEVLLSLFFLVMIVSFSFSLHVFLGVRAGDIFQSNDNQPAHKETINRNALDKMIKSFDTHAENLKTLKANKPMFIDPSL